MERRGAAGGGGCAPTRGTGGRAARARQGGGSRHGARAMARGRGGEAARRKQTEGKGRAATRRGHATAGAGAATERRGSADEGREVAPSSCTARSRATRKHAGIEDLREKREEINRMLKDEEMEKAKIQNDLTVLTKRLSAVNDSIARKIASRNEYDKTIGETEAAYTKILESSATLLTVLKRESVQIQKKTQASR